MDLWIDGLLCLLPDNQHDLSLLSGIACAVAMGATYPFADDRAATSDFKLLKRLLGL
jgi:hypothetical protein